MLQKSNQIYGESGTHRPLVTGHNWMITTDHPLATQAGASVLESGGNAVDAAIAAYLVLAVVRPPMCSAQAIQIDPENGFLLSSADPRRQAYALGS